MPPLVSVVIPTLERGDRVPQALANLARCERSGEIEVIVVDQSRDPLRLDNGMSAVLPFVLRLRTLEASNVSAARNAGAAIAAASLLLFIDDDIELCHDYIAVLLHAFARNAADVLGGRYVDDFSAEDSGGDELKYCEWLPGGNFAVRRHDFLRIGGFDENIYRFNEDAEISHRLRLSGLSIARHNRLRAIHHHRPVGGVWQHRAVLKNARDVMRNELYFCHAVGGGARRLLRAAGRNIKDTARDGGRLRGGVALARVAACVLHTPGALAYAYRRPKLLDDAEPGIGRRE